MHVWLGYPRERGTTAEHLERALARHHHVSVLDLSSLPGWRVYGGFAIPTGFPPSLAALIPDPKPDLYLEVDGLGQRHLPGTRRLRDHGIATALWGIDSHRYHRRIFHEAIMGHFDRLFLTQKDAVPGYQRLHPSVYWVPLAADAQLHQERPAERDLDIVFVGNLHPARHLDRVRLLDRLAARFTVITRDDLWGEDMARLFSRAKIVFNRSVGGDLNMRVFEAMAAGAMLLTDEIGAGLSDLFQDKKHLVTYREHDLVELAAHYLASPGERQEIARRGQAEVMAYHTYDDRAMRLTLPFTKPV